MSIDLDNLSRMKLHPLAIRVLRAWPSELVAAYNSSNERHQ